MNLNLDDMLEHVERENRLWRTYASTSWKRLEFRLSGGYRVMADKAVVYEGTDGRNAVNAYNKATRT